MVNSFYSLPEANRIDMANPFDYPELYLTENRWNEGHWNHEGATICTQKLSESFNDLIK